MRGARRVEREMYGGRRAQPFDLHMKDEQEREQGSGLMMEVEVDEEMDANWDQSWDKEKFEKFESMRHDLLQKAIGGNVAHATTTDDN